jgi:hypothetical protein
MPSTVWVRTKAETLDETVGKGVAMGVEVIVALSVLITTLSIVSMETLQVVHSDEELTIAVASKSLEPVGTTRVEGAVPVMISSLYVVITVTPLIVRVYTLQTGQRLEVEDSGAAVTLGLELVIGSASRAFDMIVVGEAGATSVV